MNIKKEITLIKFPELSKKIGISRSSVDRWENAGVFPKRIHLGENKVAWILEEINEWIKERANFR